MKGGPSGEFDAASYTASISLLVSTFWVPLHEGVGRVGCHVLGSDTNHVVQPLPPNDVFHRPAMPATPVGPHSKGPGSQCSVMRQPISVWGSNDGDLVVEPEAVLSRDGFVVFGPGKVLILELGRFARAAPAATQYPRLGSDRLQHICSNDEFWNGEHHPPIEDEARGCSERNNQAAGRD